MDENMYINITFQEEYKRLESLCKDCFSSVEGVSAYIRQLEYEQWCLQKFAVLWEEDYKMLKHIRWIRNKLSHEPGTLYSDICTEKDLNFITEFYSKIINCADPIAQLHKAKEYEKIRNIQNRQYTSYTSEPIKPTTPVTNKNSVFSKLLEKIKKLFSNL